MRRSRDDSDEAYALSLCDELLGITSRRQVRFPFLRGDPSPNRPNGVPLPVDSYYEPLALVIEYRELQHWTAVPHFDKPNVLTVSGMHRGLQRPRYEQLRRDVLPLHGIRVIEINCTDLVHNSQGRLLRRRDEDLRSVRAILAAAGVVSLPR